MTRIIEAHAQDEPALIVKATAGQIAPLVQAMDEGGSLVDVVDNEGNPANGGSLPAEWTVDAGALKIEATDPTANDNIPGITIELPAGSFDNGSGAIYVDSEFDTPIFQVDAYGVRILPQESGEFRVYDNSSQVVIRTTDTGHMGFFEGTTPVAQQTLARPSGDAGDLWDILAAYGLVKAP